jgi:hypothetical protein
VSGVGRGAPPVGRPRLVRKPLSPAVRIRYNMPR